MLAVVNFTHIVDSMLIMPLGAIFIEAFQISAGQYSFLVSAYAFAAALSGITGIFLLDKYDRKRALMVLYGGFSIGTLLCAVSTSYEMLLVMRFLTGLFGGMIGALVLSVVSDLYKFKERGRAMGILFAAFSAASAMGIPIGIYLAALSDWHLPFLIIGGMGILVFLIIWRKFPNMIDHLSEVDDSRSFIEILSPLWNDYNQRIALIAGFILILAHFMIIPFISPYMINNVGMSQEDISIQFFLGGVATLFTASWVGRLTDKYGVMKVFIGTMLLAFIPTMLITTMGRIPIWQALIVTTLFFIFASGRMIPANTSITAAAPTANRGSFMSTKSSLQQFAIGLAGVVSGKIVFLDEQKFYHNYEYVGFLSVILGVLSFYYINKIKVAAGN